MNVEDSKVDALYAISREIEKLRIDVAHTLSTIAAHLGDISSNVSEINKNTPNILDRE